MDDNSLSIDLKKLKRNLPPPPVAVAPLNIAPAVAPPPAPKVSSAPVFQTPPMQRPAAMPPRSRGWGMPGIGALQMPSIRTLIIIAATLVVVLGIGYYIYTNFWTRSPFGATQSPDIQAAGQSSTVNPADLTEAQIVEYVGKLILLPQDETPTLAKVSDPNVLQNQLFFKNAAAGDIVLMYPKSLRAILYDPVQNKIIEVGPITAATTTATSTAAK